MLRPVVLALLAASLAPACSSSSALTELVVVVSADVPVPDLRVLVVGPDGVAHVDAHVTSPTLPLSIVLTRDRAPYGPVFVHVEGGSVLSDTTTELAPGARRRLDVHLAASCLCPQCSPTETCRAGVCADRHIAASDLTPYVASGDAGLEPPLDTGGIDAGPTPDSGVSGPTCGCHMQPCCGSTCNGTYTCTMGTCLDCVTTRPSILGMTPRSPRLTGMDGLGGMLSISYADPTMPTTIAQAQFILAPGVQVTGSADFAPSSISATGSTLVVTNGTQTRTLSFIGATVSGGFAAPATCAGMPGVLTGATGAGPTLTFTACDGSSGTVTLSPVQTCQ
jgi:hypothetical protein